MLLPKRPRSRKASKASKQTIMLRKRADRKRPLPRPLVIPDVMTLTTLADVRELMRHLPEDRRARPAWRYVQKQIEQAATGADMADASIAAAHGADA